MLDDLSSVENHGETFAAALGVPDDADAAVAFGEAASRVHSTALFTAWNCDSRRFFWSSRPSRFQKQRSGG